MIFCNNIPTDQIPDWNLLLKEGFSIYEVIRVFRHHPLFLEDNLSRLRHSVEKAGFDIQIDANHLEEMLARFIRLEQIEAGNVKYLLHLHGGEITEYLFQIAHSYPSDEDYLKGVETVSRNIMRPRADIKYINLALSETAEAIRQSEHVYEVILRDDNDCITEGARSNLFFIKGDTLVTAPLPFVLPGTARKRVLDLCEREGIAVEQRLIPYSELHTYSAVFITGTSPLVLPVCRVDDLHFDVSNPLLRRVMELYFSLL